MKRGTRKQCRKNGRFVSCKKAKGIKRGKKTRCRKNGRFVICKNKRGTGKNKKTIKKPICRNNGPFTKCDNEGNDVKDVVSALLGITQAKRQPQFVAVGKAMEPPKIELKKPTETEYDRKRFNNEGKDVQNMFEETNFSKPNDKLPVDVSNMGSVNTTNEKTQLI